MWVLITMLVHMGSVSVCVCGVSVTRVCVVCYSTHHGVMSQARDNFEGFRRAHMTEEEKEVIAQVTLCLCRERLGLAFLLHPHTLTNSRSLTQALTK